MQLIDFYCYLPRPRSAAGLENDENTTPLPELQQIIGCKRLK
jgi:hypothetical protein